MKRILTIFIYLCASTLVFLHGAKQPNIDGYDKSMLHEMVRGEAYKPYVYRTLAPTIVRMADDITPDFLKDGIKNMIGKFYSIDNAFDKMGWQKEYYFEYLIAFGIMILSLAGFMFFLRNIAALLFDASPITLFLLPLFAIIALPALFKYYIYIYDFPTLFLFTLSYYLLAVKKSKWYYIAFVLACLNKETAILLSILYFLLNYKYDRKATVLNTAYQLGIWFVIKIALYLIFMNNPGVFSEFNFFEYNLPYILSPFEIGIVVTYIFFFVLLFYQWKDKPVFLRQAIWLALPLAFLSLTIGVIDEIRVYYEIYPIVVLLASHTIAKWIGFKYQAREVY